MSESAGKSSFSNKEMKVCLLDTLLTTLVLTKPRRSDVIEWIYGLKSVNIEEDAFLRVITRNPANLRQDGGVDVAAEGELAQEDEVELNEFNLP